MNLAQIQDVLKQAGWSDGLIPTMAAIAMAESTGNPNAHNPVPPDDSYGLWQINMIGALGPERRRAFGLSSNSQLYDPLTNARAALSIYRSQGLKAWSTYTNKAYTKYIAASQAAFTPGGSSGSSGGIVPVPIPSDGGNSGGDWLQTPLMLAGFSITPFILILLLLLLKVLRRS